MHERPNLVLSAEEELGITAGLQDRVVQVYGGVVYMDFDRDHMQEHGYGRCCTSSSYTNACLKAWIHLFGSLWHPALGDYCAVKGRKNSPFCQVPAQQEALTIACLMRSVAFCKHMIFLWHNHLPQAFISKSVGKRSTAPSWYEKSKHAGRLHLCAQVRMLGPCGAAPAVAGVCGRAE